MTLPVTSLHIFSNVAFHFQPITDDDVDRIATCLRVLAERSDLMQEIFNEACRGSLSVMLAAKIEEDKAAQEVHCFLSFSFPCRLVSLLMVLFYCVEDLVLGSRF